MDPLSISVSCITLITTITQVSVAVTNFVREVRDARGDLDAISRELVSLKSVLELLAEDTEERHSAVLPERLKDQILDILKNCKHVVTDVEASLKKHSASRLGRAGHWAVGGGKGDMMKFRSSLETHKTALGLALDMVAITITRDIKDDTQEIRKDTVAIKDDTALILEQIAQLQAQLPQNIIKDTSNHMLHRYLDDLSNFAELMSNPQEDEPEALTAVNSEDEDKSTSSPPSIHKDSETSDRRPSSFLREMYTEASGTSTSRKSVQHIQGVPPTSPTPGNALNPTGASRTGTPDEPLTAQQDGPSQSDLRPDQVENPPKIPEARPTVQNDNISRLRQGHSIPLIKHQIQKPNPVVWSLPIAPWAPASYEVPNPKAQPSTSSAASPNTTPTTETSAPKAKENLGRKKDEDYRRPNTSRKTPAKLATKPPSKSTSAAKPGNLKGSRLRSTSPEEKDRQSPVPAPAPGSRVRVARTGGAASWGFWGHASKKASS